LFAPLWMNAHKSRFATSNTYPTVGALDSAIQGARHIWTSACIPSCITAQITWNELSVLLATIKPKLRNYAGEISELQTEYGVRRWAHELPRSLPKNSALPVMNYLMAGF